MPLMWIGAMQAHARARFLFRMVFIWEMAVTVSSKLTDRLVIWCPLVLRLQNSIGGRTSPLIVILRLLRLLRLHLLLLQWCLSMEDMFPVTRMIFHFVLSEEDLQDRQQSSSSLPEKGVDSSELVQIGGLSLQRSIFPADTSVVLDDLQSVRNLVSEKHAISSRNDPSLAVIRFSLLEEIIALQQGILPRFLSSNNWHEAVNEDQVARLIYLAGVLFPNG